MPYGSFTPDPRTVRVIVNPTRRLEGSQLTQHVYSFDSVTTFQCVSLSPLVSVWVQIPRDSDLKVSRTPSVVGVVPTDQVPRTVSVFVLSTLLVYIFKFWSRGEYPGTTPFVTVRRDNPGLT